MIILVSSNPRRMIINELMVCTRFVTALVLLHLQTAVLLRLK